MGTPYSKVYSSFLLKITDPLYGGFSPEELSQDLLGLLDSSIIEFEFPKVNIRDRDNEKQEFNVELSQDDVEILAYLMVDRWIERQVNDAELMSQRFSTRDFKLDPQSSKLAVLIKSQERLQKKISQLKRKYSYRKTNNLGNEADFSGL